ncbi:MAG: molecular chaperone HtpG [Ruminococcus sp.]|nr:molecular chaperone HtpG [Ruminococcus sp.]
METKQFQAESKRLLEMMIHSIYTHKEIFLRELISNASDAMDKLYFKSLSDNNVGHSRDEFEIMLTVNKDARTITITDNGIGMTKDELENNLGIIANSGSLKFKSENKLDEDVDIIGQFGVGFYSAFMIAKKVTVRTRAFGSDQAYEWESEGVDGYTIAECDKETVGTEIILTVKDDAEEESYSEFLEQYRLQGIVKKYSDYIRYPIKMEMKHSRKKEGTPEGEAPEFEDYFEIETLNSMVPLWKKNKNELKDEDYNQFYKEKFYDYTDPLLHIHSKSEGTATYNALLYIPAKAPYDYYTKEFEKGLQLFANGVMIMEKCADLLPDYFSFVRGLVDSEDLSLNISREMLQHDRQLKIIAKAIEKSVKNELTKMLRNDREQYEKFFEAFGLQLKFGVYNGYGMNKDTLKDLLLFHSSSENKLTTLEEYVSRMREGQTCIYYATGETIARIDHLPQTELVKDKGFEILYLTENVDEFALKMMHDYDGKEFKSVSASDLNLETEEEKKEIEKKSETYKDLFSSMKESLGDKVAAVRLSSRLKSHPVCLTSDGELSLEMEKVLNAMPTDQKVKADRVLELNADHPVFATLTALAETDKEKLATYTSLLYNQALLIEGMSIEDPVAFSNAICELMK